MGHEFFDLSTENTWPKSKQKEILEKLNWGTIYKIASLCTSKNNKVSKDEEGCRTSLD